MNKIINKLSKINLLTNTAVKLIGHYKDIKLKFIDFEYEQAKDPSISKENLIAYNKNRKFTVDKNICFAPKKSMLFSFDGSVYLCCENKNETIGDVTKESLHDIWFSEKRDFLDKQINRNYNLSHGCNNCDYKILNKNYSTVQAQNFDLYTNNRSAYPARLEFEIHNTCNLECIMCSGAYSSSIQSNRYKLPAIPMVYTIDFVNQLDEFIPHLKSINLLGGEPTLIKPYYDIIEKVIALNPACFIHLQTNASTLNSRFKKLLEKGNFEIGISMDSLTPELAEDIRINLDFNKFIDNVHYYIKLYKKGNIKLTINTCAMPDNWQEIIPIIKFCNQHQLPIFFCIVNAPYYNTFVSTSIEFIENVYRELEQSLSQLPQKNYYEKNNYKQLEDFLNMLQSWKSEISEFDKNKEKLSQYSVTELYRLYENRIDSLLTYEHKQKLISETIEYTRFKFEVLDEASQKELLISLLNVVKNTILMSSEKEYIKWAHEYINTLVYSYERKVLCV